MKKLNVRREANTIFDLQTNLLVVAVVVASFKPTHLSHRSMVLYLSLSFNLSLPLPLSWSMLIFEEDWIFFITFFCWFGLYIQISYYNIQSHPPEIIFISEKYFHLQIFYTLKSFYMEPNLDFCSCFYVLVCSCFNFFFLNLLLQWIFNNILILPLVTSMISICWLTEKTKITRVNWFRSHLH